MRRENRYLVIKHTDADRYLTEMEREILKAISQKVQENRMRDGRGKFACVVVEHDWPEYEPTWAAIEKRVDGPQRELTT